MRLKNGEKWKFKTAKASLQESKHHDPELEFVYGNVDLQVFPVWERARFRRMNAIPQRGVVAVVTYRLCPSGNGRIVVWNVDSSWIAMRIVLTIS